MKDEILKQLCSANFKLRVVFATLALGMGVNIPNVRCVIHFGVPGSVRQYYKRLEGQEEITNQQEQSCITTIEILVPIGKALEMI